MQETSGKLIVLEGTDGSGKATQLQLLRDKLEATSVVTVFDFPRYNESVYGDLVGRSLAGEFGDFLQVSPYWSSLPYALDRASARPQLNEALTRGHVLCNRYTPSNIVHQSAKLPESERQAFTEFIEKGEYEELGLPRPDAVLYLYVHPDVAATLIEKKDERSYVNKGAKDQLEDDIEYQTTVSDVYRSMSGQRDDWILIDCMDGGRILSREAIHAKIMKVVTSIVS